MTTEKRSSEHPPGFAQDRAGDTSVAGTEPGGPCNYRIESWSVDQGHRLALCNRPKDHEGNHRYTPVPDDAQRTRVDPWDETPVTFPRGLLSVLLDAADKADEAGLLGECPSKPCPSCTALQDAHEAVFWR